MAWLKAVIAEFIGLFVDDGNFAAAIIVWLGIVWLLLPRLLIGSILGGLVLFTGLAVILAESALRGARRSGGQR
jgi:hypothetical protein